MMRDDPGIERCDGGVALMFDVAGVLRGWSAGASSWPGLAGKLAVGTPLADFEDWCRRYSVTDQPLADGGLLRMVAPPRDNLGDLPDRLFAAASHDLRQPLAALSLLIGALEGRLDDRVTTERILSSMDNAVRLMKVMVDGHFDLMRLGSGLIRPDIGPHAINGVLTRLSLDAAPSLTARAARFSVLPCSARVRSDPALLERILQGLMINALRQPSVTHLVLGCRRRGDHVRIELWNDGRGPNPAELAELESQLAGTSGGEAQLNLGLRLVRGMAARLGHRIEVRSLNGRGAVFTILVPLVRDAEVMEPCRPLPPPPPAVLDVSLGRVLVIEDDPMVLSALTGLLQQWGCGVTGAESYDGLLAAVDISGPPPDLIIADLRLKGADSGIVAIRQLARRFDSDVPGLILTGDVDRLRLREARLSGYPLLQKPVTALALRAALAQVKARRGRAARNIF